MLVPSLQQGKVPDRDNHLVRGSTDKVLSLPVNVHCVYIEEGPGLSSGFWSAQQLWCSRLACCAT
jgi:hypothetical protein